MTSVDFAGCVAHFRKITTPTPTNPAPDQHFNLLSLNNNFMRIPTGCSKVGVKSRADCTASSEASGPVLDTAAAMSSVSEHSQRLRSSTVPNQEPPQYQHPRHPNPNSHHGISNQNPMPPTTLNDVQTDMESLAITTDFGAFVAAESDTRPRSNSLHLKTGNNPYKYPCMSAVHQSRLDDRFTRAGSADNILNQQKPETTNRLTHSNTITELPSHYRDALSNDSGYDTPPFQRPHTVPAWPSANRPQQLISPPPGSVVLNPKCQSNPRAIPHNQRLTIDVGHFQPEPDQPELVIAEPITYAYHPLSTSASSYGNTAGPDPRYSMPLPRNTPSSASEEGVIGYQRERCDRLEQAYQCALLESYHLEDQLAHLHKQIEKTRNELCVVDPDTAKEVENLKRENENLRREIENLQRAVDQAQVQPTPPSRPPPPSTPEQRPVTAPVYPVVVADEQQWSCPVCTYINHALVVCCEMCETRRPAYIRGEST